MGLAASQARFLGITARKAECEYKSTVLAQEKLQLSEQLSNISAEYANSLNATKLVWQNELSTYDYGLTYGLVMTPSAANDFNPYMLTTMSGAIVLSSEFAAAAKAAGISKTGGVPSQDQRDRFIAALVPGGVITQQTANAITFTDYVAKDNGAGGLTLTAASLQEANAASVEWNSKAGLGAEPMNTATVDAMDLASLIMSKNIGQVKIDWAQLFISEADMSKQEYEKEEKRLKDEYNAAQMAYDQTPDKSSDDAKSKEQAMIEAKNKLEELQKTGYKTFKEGITGEFTDNFQTDGNKIKNHWGPNKNPAYTVIQNGLVNFNATSLQNMTIGDLLSNQVVLLLSSTNPNSSNEFSDSLKVLMKSIASVFGQGQTGVGLNVDKASSDALDYALNMLERKFLNPGKTVQGGSFSDRSMIDNGAYKNAVSSNSMAKCSGTADGGLVIHTAVSLTNMLSCFLTYFDNYLMGTNSNFIVGASTDTSSYVTDCPTYNYLGRDTEEPITMDKKIANFYDQLYNNICEFGWRQDDYVHDPEYLESVLKDGRYSMSSLHNDGYYYQTRYNETGYMVEVTDEDAIARAEAEFSQMKAQLTYKEDSIDMKTKKLDAEISMLTTEYDTVKTLISKSIEKAFTMFQN